MKTLQDILLIGFLILSLTVSGQDLKFLNTEDLIKISEDYGVDSALSLTHGNPIFYIDKFVAKKLTQESLNNLPSDGIENFLVDYALHITDKDIPELLFRYFDRKRNEIKDYFPKEYGGLPEISDDALMAMIEHSTKNTDSLFIKYYYEWDKKSTIYKPNYLIGLAKKDQKEKEKLMTPFEDCNTNCYKILLALDKLDSKFFDKVKLQKHQKYLPSYLQGGFCLGRSGDYTDYKKRNVFYSIKLKTNYNTIGEINFNKEPELQKLLNRNNESFCWKFIMYNNKLGYLDLGCQSGPEAGSGELFRLELKGNKLIIHEIQFWVS